MALAGNPMADLGPTPTVSKQTIHMCGLLVDVYGLAELQPAQTRVSCLWLHHARQRAREDMADIAARCIAAWNHAAAKDDQQRQKGLIALAFDQRNHGSRLVSAMANAAWRGGNPRHAQDMFGIIAGTVEDQRLLLDAVGGYLFQAQDGVRREFDQHLVLGVSLGGHSVWQTMCLEPRITAGVVIVGCPDYINLVSDRARLSKLSTYKAGDGGASFVGSKDFPASLLAACEKYDPKAQIFSAGLIRRSAVGDALPKQQRQAIAGKKFLLCFGADDKLVPYRCSKPFLDWFKQAVQSPDLAPAIWLEEQIYAGIGHVFSKEMVERSVQFVCEAVSGELDDRLKSGSVVLSFPGDQSASKI